MRLTLVAAALLLTFQTISYSGAIRAQEATARPAATPDVDDDEVERVSVHVVSVPVSVTDRDGRFVANLRAEDFTVAENGRAQTVSYFASVEQPFSVLLLLDTSGSNRLRLQDMQEAAVRFIEQLRPQDRALPVAFDNDTVALLGEWSSDRARLASAIRSARTGMFMGPKDIETRKDNTGKPFTVRHVNTRLYDAVHKTVEELRRMQGRKALILFTDGLDTDSTVATFKSTHAAAEELDALIYVVRYLPYGGYMVRADERPPTTPRIVGGGSGKAPMEATAIPGGGVQQATTPNAPSTAPRVNGAVASMRTVGPLGMGVPKLLEAEKYLNGLAERTGGRVYVADDLERIAQSFTSIAEELRRMYSIGYSPTPLARPGERREVKIKVLRERLSVRARRAYVFRPL